MYAIICTGGKQYRVENDDVIYVEKLDAKEGEEVSFDVMLLGGEGTDTRIGKPFVAGATVTGKVVKNVKSAKILVFKYKAKKNERKRQGHRQPYTKVQITGINA